MKCSLYAHENPDGSAFCEECGTPLELRCPSCGSACAASAKFCRNCGAALVARPDVAETRKVVTIVFADLIGSTSLHERLDPESVNRLMDHYYRAVRVPVEAHGGSVVQLLGDGVMCAFGVPQVAADDAIRAVRAAVGIQQAFHEFAREHGDVASRIGLRVAVNTGEVVVTDEHAAGIGDPLNVAARLQQEAHDGDVLIGESTRRLVSELVTLAPFGVFSLKGRAETVAAYRVVSLERPAGATATAFVGRDDELRRMMAVYDAAVAAPAARLAVILGSPGLGKSRLLEELAHRLGGTATVVTAHCDAEGGATFAPLAEALRELLRRAAHEPASPAPAQSVAPGSGLVALSGLSSAHSVEDQQPQPGGQPIAWGSAPGAGGAAEDLRAALDAAIPGADAERARIVDGIMALLGGSPASPEETFFVVRRFLTALTATRPVLLAIDDLQWAEPLLLDLVEHLVQWGSGVPLLVLAAARPELRDSRSSLAAPGRLVTEVVTLAGLDAAAATRLAANVIGADVLPAAVAGRVLATSEGNPLFVGELVRMLVNDGALKREGDRWTTAVDLAALDMPPTIHALLAARIERLRPEDRAVLERAAVVGRQFSRSAVAHLLPREITDLDARLEALRRSEVIEPDTGWFLGEPALRFHHGLTRDAAYRRVLKGTRAELHARLADWIESKVAGAIEHDETLGWHLEQAHQHLRELGPIDVQGRAFGERAARYLAAAGRRALARDDLPVAAHLLGRALHMLDESDTTRADLALDWCEALLSAGDVGPATKAIAELGRLIDRKTPAPAPDGVDLLRTRASMGSARAVDASGSQHLSARPELVEGRGASPQSPAPGPDRLRAWHTCFVGQLAVLTDPQALHATADAVAAAAEELTAAGDTAGEAKAHSVHAAALQRLGKIGACEAALDKALAAARRAHDRRRSNAVLAGAPLAALWGPSPVTRASGRCLDVVRVLRITQGAPAVEAVALRCQAVLEVLRGRTEAARRMIASSRRMVEELGITQGLLEADMFAGLIELIEGDAGVAERSLRAAYEGLRTHGLGIDAARAAALLARALFAQGRAEEAEALSHESEALAGDDLQAAIAWRRVRAEALAQRGEHRAAVEVARTAVDIVGATDALLLHADARMALAAALRRSGQSKEADAEEARAIELWEAKGATLLAERARRAVRRIVQAEQAPAERVGLALPVRRRVRPNAATANAARMDAAIAARNADAFPALLAAGARCVHHPTDRVFGREAWLDDLRSILAVDALGYANEPLATLGNSLALCRRCASFLEAGDFGPTEMEAIVLIEVDAEGGRVCTEVFAADRLADAVARLYERYAELLPDGPARTRAAATARSVATLAGPVNVDRWAAAIARGVEFADHRTLGIGSARGAEAFLRGLGSLLEVANDVVNRADDVLAVRSDAVLLRRTNFGTERAGGGAYERLFLVLWVFGADGLLARLEQFDTDRDAEALARFDELTAEPPTTQFAPLPSRTAEQRERRVRPNAATANAARIEAAIAARDADAFPLLVADDMEGVHHATGATYDRRSALYSFHAVLRATDARFSSEPLATLGDSLALCRTSVSASGVSGGNFDVGAYESEEIYLIEADAQGRRRCSEIFATNHLGDAVARLYERYADLLPDGPERARAAATARSVAAMLDPPDVDRWGAALAPAADYVDHRTLGFPSVRGARALLRGLRTLFEVSENHTMRVDDLLDLRSDALLVHQTRFGTGRAGGGTYEKSFIDILIFGADGLVSRWEEFDVDRDAEALARFDELVGNDPSVSPLGKGSTKEGSPARTARRVQPNAATANMVRLDAVMAARDGDALPVLLADEMEVVEHYTGAAYDREGALASLRALLGARNPAYWHESLATLGDALTLCRLSVSASGLARGTFDVGAYQTEMIEVIEVDASGRRRRSEVFAPDHLGDAVARLYERYAELLPDGPERARAAATARSVAALLGPFDPERYATAYAPAIEVVDHRTLGTWSARGAQAVRQHFRSLHDVAADVSIRQDDILDLRSDAYIVHQTNSGTDRVGGGVYERQFLQILMFGTDGLVTRMEQFDSDRLNEALARLDEVTQDRHARELQAGIQEGGVDSRPTPSRGQAVKTAGMTEGTIAGMMERAQPTRRRVRANAAIANARGVEAAVAARDANAFATFIAEDAVTVDHLNGAEFDRAETLRLWRTFLSAEDFTFAVEPLATLGESLALSRDSTSASGVTRGKFDVGPYKRDRIDLVEVDAQGRRRRSEHFADDRLGDAVARLYERYADLLPDGPERARATATARSVAATIGPLDVDRANAAHAPCVELVDHRTLGFGSARGVEALAAGNRALFELASDIAVRLDDILALRPDALLVLSTTSGTDRTSGGAFETTFLSLRVYGPDGKTMHVERFDPEGVAEALARFDELVGSAGAHARHARNLQAGIQAGGVDSRPKTAGMMEGKAAELPAGPPAERFGNAASRFIVEFGRALDRRDWDGLVALIASGHVFDDRRALVRTRVEGEAYFVHLRFMFDGVAAVQQRASPASRPGRAERSLNLLATRGDRLALDHVKFSLVVGDAGPAEFEMLNLVEVDSAGRRVALLSFDPDDLDAAYAELDERYAAGEAAAHDRASAWLRAFRRVFASRDWDALAALCAPTLVADNHRLVGWGTLRGGAAWVQTLRTLVDLAPDVWLRLDHVRMSDRGSLWENVLLGSRDGGSFEIPVIAVAELDELGKQNRLDLYDLDQLDQALARFDELALSTASRFGAQQQGSDSGPTGKGQNLIAQPWALDEPSASSSGRSVRPLLEEFANAATRSMDQMQDAMNRRDWDGLVALYASSPVIDDRRSLVRTRVEGEAYFAHLKLLFDAQSGERERVLLATRGDRLALHRNTRTAVARYGGLAEFEMLNMTEVDAGGRRVAIVVFDPDDLDAAYAELDARYAAGEAAAFAPQADRLSVLRTFPGAAPDWESFAALFAPDFVVEDHSPLGWGTFDRPAYIESVKVLAALAPDTRVRTDHLWLCDDGALGVHVVLGTHEGGAFEQPRVTVSEVDAQGRERRRHLYALDQLDAARARFAALRESSPSHEADSADPLAALIKPNAAARARGRITATRDWDALRALVSAGFVFDDRRKRSLVSGDVELWIRNLEMVRAIPGRHARELIGTAGDRIALERVVWTGNQDGGAFENEFLGLTEINAEGQLTASTTFDPEDRCAAFAEAQARFVAGEAAAIGGQAPIVVLARAFARHDWETLRRCLADDFVLHDHRTLGLLGTLRSDEWVESMRVQADLAPDSDVETLRIIAWNRHGRVEMSRVFGTMRDGGLFENVLLRVLVTDGDRIQRFDAFDIGDADQALACFEELCAEREQCR